MVAVPVDLKIITKGLNVLKQLERQVKNLKTDAGNIPLTFNTRAANTQLQGVDRRLDAIQRDARNIKVGFAVDNSGLSGGGGGTGDFLTGAAFASALKPAKELQKTVQQTKPDIAKWRANQELLEEANAAGAKFNEIQGRIAAQQERQKAAQSKINIQQGQVTRLTNRETAAKKAGRKVTEAMVSELVTAKELLKNTRAEITGSATSMRNLATQAERYNRAAKGFTSGRGFQAPAVPPPPQRNARRRAQTIAGQAGTALSAAGSNAFLGLGAGAALTSTLGSAADFGQSQVKLKALSEEYGEYNRILKLTKENAETFNFSQAESAKLFGSVYARLRPLGIELEDIQSTFKGFNAVAIAGGATAQESAAAFTQLTQALGSGRLQGDEFRSISEAVPGILRLVSKEMGVTVGELKKLGSEGKITSEVLINSLANGFEENKDLIKQILDESPAAKFKGLGNALSDLSTTVGTELLPVVIPMVEGLTEAIRIFGKMPQPVKTAASALFGFGAAATAAAAGLKLLGISAAAAGGFAVLAAKIGLVLAPFAGLALVIQDNIDRKKAFDEAMTTNDLDVLLAQTEKTKTELNQMREALKLLESSAPFKGQAGDVEDLKRRIAEAEDQVIKLTQRRTLFIDVVFGIPNFDKKGAGFDEDLAKELEKLGLKWNGAGKAVTDIKGSGGGGGGGGAGRESQLPQLNAEVKAAEELLTLNRQLLEAQYQEDKAAIQQIRRNIIMAESEAAIAQIQLEKIPALEKAQKIRLAEIEAIKQMDELAVEALVTERDRIKSYDELITALDNEIELSGIKGQLAKELQQIEHDIVDLKKQGLLVGEQEVQQYREKAQEAARLRNPGKLEQYMTKLSEDLNDTEGMIVSLATTVEREIGNAMSNAITGLIDGTKTAQEAFADMFANIGKAFIDMATQMIAKALVMKALGILFPGAGAATGGGGVLTGGLDFSSAFSGGTGVPNFFAPRALGGPVDSNAPYMVGENGPELFIPNQSGRIETNSAMNNYMPGGSGGGGGGNVMVNYSGPQLNFNGDEYLPKSAVGEIIDQAALKGAKLGEARTVSNLRNNRSTRTRAGV